MRLRALTRRQALSEAGRAGVGGALALALPPQLLAGSSPARGARRAAPASVQDAILTELDDSGSDFFSALYNQTLEGVYSHPVYGGNRDYRAWRAFGYAGDVHGVRFPHLGPPSAPWNVYGGYAPQEMVKPGRGT